MVNCFAGPRKMAQERESREGKKEMNDGSGREGEEVREVMERRGREWE